MPLTIFGSCFLKSFFLKIKDKPEIKESHLVGVPRVELGFRPPEGRVLPLYYTPFLLR